MQPIACDWFHAAGCINLLPSMNAEKATFPLIKSTNSVFVVFISYLEHLIVLFYFQFGVFVVRKFLKWVFQRIWEQIISLFIISYWDFFLKFELSWQLMCVYKHDMTSYSGCPNVVYLCVVCCVCVCFIREWI